MSTLLVDLKNEVQSGASFYAGTTNATGAGTHVDLENGHVATNAVLNVGVFSGTTVNVKMQESNVTTATSTDWTDITGGAFTAFTGTTREILVFQRSKRYVRANVGTFSGTSITFAVEVFAQRKVAPYGSTYAGYDRSPST